MNLHRSIVASPCTHSPKPLRTEDAHDRATRLGWSRAVLLAVLALTFSFCTGVPLAHAQLEENLSSFTDATAEGYLKPLAEAFGQNLNTGLFTTAAIPKEGFHARLEIQAMSVFFDDADDTFIASTGGDFSPVTETEASTVVGPTTSVTVDGDGGTAFVFPGGFDLGSFTLAVPQLTIGSVAGTEATIRWIGVDTGDAEIGDIDLLGIGVRHSISQYLDEAPLDLAVSGFWQKLSIGNDDLLDAKTVSFGVQGSKRFGVLEPFGSVALDSFKVTSEYTTNAGAEDEESVKVDFDRSTTLHLLLGLGARLGVVHLYIAGNIADRTGVSAGLTFGM